jgi:unsaturated chondroitin disaccharide hydrolase
MPDLDRALTLVLERCLRAAEEVPSGQYPVWADDDGRWRSSGPAHWAAGFATGARWLAEACGRPSSARPMPAPVVPEDVVISSFHAFTGWYAGQQDVVADRVARRLSAALLADRALAVTESDLRADRGHAVAYVDAVGPASALLASYVDHEVGARHARWTMHVLQQPDGSLLQCARIDLATGAVDEVYTAAQGYSRSSRWSRAQAWGLLGAAMAPPGCVEPEGRALADWWLATAPRREAPPWDFTAPPEGPVDTSAGAIAAAAFLRLASSAEVRSGAYRRAGLDLLTGMLDHIDASGALGDGCYHLRAGVAPRNELVWGDYYLAEALALATGALSPSSGPTRGRPPALRA